MAHRLAPEAEADLDDIWYYTAKESGSIEIADRLIDSITERLFLLAKLRVIRKGGKQQYVPLNPEAQACIEEEVKFRRGLERSQQPMSRYLRIGTAGGRKRFEDR